ncbi:uncharacterized protein ARB_04405 [Trichophyton benhamiae CBS 112371]|uniref:Uncharacterized protein n=1 Tax=Arthroderma benhamiae (strain ATCC MYA-4681 / CBS 112371) TaxID=663331 RepID=D4AJF5_ARTBC|nr:uncharacterized protein ARB_04405 [Trichophyton benhamiae CBS 112371]EFE36878.1 hypothetical protein ARB_04405 [Trichophyton benhamiae CBS 112371]
MGRSIYSFPVSLSALLFLFLPSVVPSQKLPPLYMMPPSPSLSLSLSLSSSYLDMTDLFLLYFMLPFFFFGLELYYLPTSLIPLFLHYFLTWGLIIYHLLPSSSSSTTTSSMPFFSSSSSLIPRRLKA